MNTIEFPGLWGLEFTIDPVAFKLFGTPLYWYGIIIAAAFLTAVLLAMRSSHKYGIESDSIIDLVLYIAPISIIGARLYYVIFKWSDFKDNPVEIFLLRKGGLAIYGGVLSGFLVAYIFQDTKK